MDKLKELQREEELAASDLLERQKALDAEKLATKQRAHEAIKAGKQREKESQSASLPLPKRPTSTAAAKKTSPTMQPPALPPPHAVAAPPHTNSSTLENVRHTVLSFFSSADTATRQAAPSFLSLPAWLRYHYAQDPLRLMGIICFVMAFLSYMRRSLRSRSTSRLSIGAALRLAVQKVSETVQMGTRITTL